MARFVNNRNSCNCITHSSEPSLRGRGCPSSSFRSAWPSTLYNNMDQCVTRRSLHKCVCVCVCNPGGLYVSVYPCGLYVSMLSLRSLHQYVTKPSLRQYVRPGGLYISNSAVSKPAYYPQQYSKINAPAISTTEYVPAISYTPQRPLQLYALAVPTSVCSTNLRQTKPLRILQHYSIIIYSQTTRM